jgi:uncharacterized membrane protein
MFRRGGYFFNGPVMPAWSWVLIGAIGVILLFVAVALVLRRRRVQASQRKGLSEAQRYTLEEFEGQVLAMLFQHGGQLSQLQIASSLGLPAERVAERLHKMETEGQIERRWSAEEYTYSVRRPSD